MIRESPVSLFIISKHFKSHSSDLKALYIQVLFPLHTSTVRTSVFERNLFHTTHEATSTRRRSNFLCNFSMIKQRILYLFKIRLQKSTKFEIDM